MRTAIILLVTLLFIFACKRQSENHFEAFYIQTLNVIQDYSIKKDSLDWDILKKTVYDSIIRFNSNEDVYSAIGYTIKLIDDGHSIFVAAQNPETITNPFLIDTLSIPSISSRIIDGRIGYIRLPGFIANDSLSAKYALQIRKTLMNIDTTANLSGWIIDLRINSGGKLTSEPLGLSPLFSLPLIGISCDNNNKHKNIMLIVTIQQCKKIVSY